MQKRLIERRRRLSLEDTWKLVNAPVDEDNVELLATLALAVAGDTAQRSLLTFLLDAARLRDATLEEAEQAGRVASILRWFALQYPGVGGVTIERAAALEEAAAARVVSRLQVEVADADGRPLPLVRRHRVRPGFRSATAVSHDPADPFRDLTRNGVLVRSEPRSAPTMPRWQSRPERS